MIAINIKGVDVVRTMLAAAPKQASRAAEIALDFTAKAIRDDLKKEMRTVFDRPTPFTLNSLQVTPTRGHNMQASVWFKEPARMGQHYLVPQVEGGARKLKGFERGVDLGELIPTRIGAKLDRYGNISAGQIKQIMSVLGKAETSAGYMANITARSRKRNTKERDYVVIDGQQRGRLPLGVYQRVQSGVGFGAKTKRTFLDRSKSYQKGRTRGRFASVIRARGLKPILLEGHTGHAVKPLLDFYGVAHRTFGQVFEPKFSDTLKGMMG